MPSELIISVSGLRGVVGESLTTDVAARYALAFAAELPPGPVVIGYDGRSSGPDFVRAIAAALANAERQVLDAGPAATPTVGVLVTSKAAAGGVQVSASHNPPQYNGLKLFSGAGRVLPAEQGARVLQRYRQASVSSRAPQSAESPPVAIADAAVAHVERVLGICDVERIRAKRYRVLLDANHGAGGMLGRALLERLGCDCVVLGGSPDGQFAHPPEPTAENLASVVEQAGRQGVDVCFCQDPDADRLAIIDERGRYIGEEKTLALCVDHVLRTQRRIGPIVANCSTSRMSEALARRYGVPFFRSKVGEANVVDLMLQENAVLGGEGNGGVIDPRVGLVRDSFAGMALVLDAMAARGLPASALADELPQYAIHKTAIVVGRDQTAAAIDALEQRFADATASRLDGLRLDWPDGAWLLVRPSNTEPIVRAIAEAPAAERAESLCRQAAVVLGHG